MAVDPRKLAEWKDRLARISTVTARPPDTLELARRALSEIDAGLASWEALQRRGMVPAGASEAETRWELARRDARRAQDTWALLGEALPPLLQELERLRALENVLRQELQAPVADAPGDSPHPPHPANVRR